MLCAKFIAHQIVPYVTVIPDHCDETPDVCNTGQLINEQNSCMQQGFINGYTF